MTDISTKAIIERCDHIDHCSLNTHHQDALRMRALVAERDTLVKQAEDCARICAKQADKITVLSQSRYDLAYAIAGGEDTPGLLDSVPDAELVEMIAKERANSRDFEEAAVRTARNTALVEAAEKIAGPDHVDSELRRGRLQAPGVLTRAFEAILSLRSGPLGDCPECSGSGMRDSGGVQPWGEHIDVPCDCGNAPRPKSKASTRDKVLAEVEAAFERTCHTHTEEVQAFADALDDLRRNATPEAPEGTKAAAREEPLQKHAWEPV